jgi:BatD DUF11 like domain
MMRMMKMKVLHYIAKMLDPTLTLPFPGEGTVPPPGNDCMDAGGRATQGAVAEGEVRRGSETPTQKPILGFATQPTRVISILFTLFLLIFAAPTFANNLTASVDRDNLGLSETLTLTLRYDEQINTTPNYSLLQKDFEILHTQSGRNMSIINGRAESYTEWKIILAPRKTGKLLIPSFNIDGSISDAIEITVEKQSSQSKAMGSEPVTVEIETDKDSVYVQEQIVLTIKLVTTVSLSGAQLDPLSITDTFITELDEKNYKTTINNKPALIVEKRFAIYPLKSGTLTIPALRYQVQIDDGDVFSRIYGNNNNILRLMTDEKVLDIKAAPTDQSNWLPAENLHISEHWSAGLDNLKVGEPISRTVTITAQGLTAAQIPPLASMNIDGLTFYQDQAQTDDQKNPKGNQGSRIETTAVIPNKTGKFTLPEIKINWWNTKTKTYEVASLPAVTLNVTSGGNQIINDQQSNNQTTEETNESTVDDSSNPATPRVNTISQQTPWWIYALLAFTSLLSIIALLAWWNLRQRFNTYVLRKAQEETHTVESETQAWNQIKNYLQNNQLIELRHAIIDWAKLYWKKDNIQSLYDVASLANSIALQDAFTNLDASLFGSESHSFDKQKLKELLSNLRRGKMKQATTEDELRPLYNK